MHSSNSTTDHNQGSIYAVIEGHLTIHTTNDDWLSPLISVFSDGYLIYSCRSLNMAYDYCLAVGLQPVNCTTK